MSSASRGDIRTQKGPMHALGGGSESGREVALSPPSCSPELRNADVPLPAQNFHWVFSNGFLGL